MDKIKKGYFVTTFASETPFHPKIEIFLAPLVGQIFQDNGIVHPNLNKLTRADARKKLIPHYSNVSSVLEKAFNLKINFNFIDYRKNSKTYNKLFQIIMSQEDYFRLTVPPNIFFAFKGLNSNINMLVNIADIPHDPNEIIRKELNEIKFCDK